MSENLVDYARKEAIYGLARIEDAGGRAALGIIVEGHLQAIAVYLTGVHGPQGAYDIFTRHAEGIIQPVLDQKAKRAVRLMPAGLTVVQGEALQFIGAYLVHHNGVSPSYDEIAEHLKLGNKGRVHQIVLDLEERGAITRLPGRSRTIALTDPKIGTGFVVDPVPEVRAAIDAYAREHKITVKTAAEEALRAFFMEPRGQ